MGEIVLYSCVVNGVDRLDHLLGSSFPPDPQVRRVLFTDVPACQIPQAKHWQILRPCWGHINPRRVARYHKINAHLVLPEADCSIWLDGAYEILPNFRPREFCQAVLASRDLAAFEHPLRDCVYQEADACVYWRKGYPQLLRRQVQRYREEGYPEHAGLVETGCVCRRHTPQIRQFNERWWQEIEAHSLRDQLSFNYAAWKLGISYAHVPGSGYASRHFRYHRHL